ncbi:positive regulation of cristae formation [Mactra antiquata]
MTSKVFTSTVLRKVKQVLQGVLKTPNVGVKVTKTSKPTRIVQPAVRFHSALTPSRLNNIWKKALPNYFFKSLARDLGHQAAWRRARNLPLFAFVGLIVQQHSDEEDEQIADRIQEFVKNVNISSSTLLQQVQALSLDKFEFGQMIGQGCNAAVYEACLKNDEIVDSVVNQEDCEVNTNDDNPEPVILTDDVSDTESDITVLDEDKEESFGFNDDDSDIVIINVSDEEANNYEEIPLIFHVDDDRDEDFMDDSKSDSDVSLLSWPDSDEYSADDENDYCDGSLENEPDLGIEEGIEIPVDNGISPVNVELGTVGPEDGIEKNQMFQSFNSNDSAVGDKFNLAVKMMFNYGIESNADAILREMDRETVPAILAQSHGQMSTWSNGNKVRKKSLPPHSNIVEMWGVFVDPVPHLPDSLLNYPAALPSRINPDGIGRNMTMFLVMKKYQCTLAEYLSTFNPSFRERLIILGQLLEAVAHMRRHNIAHRDLKLDNIFLDTTKGVLPQLVVGDFGCCLADGKHGLQIPYTSDHIDRGGNTALMAPEISTAEPGLFQYLDYRKADLWAVGTLAYEILGGDNPFYTNKNRQRLDSRTYKMSELPPLPDNTPQPLITLIYSMLQKDPSMRPTARFAADIIQVLLWAPSDWTSPGNTLSRSEVNWWLVSMATEVLLGTNTPERILKSHFVKNINMRDLKSVFASLDLKM